MQLEADPAFKLLVSTVTGGQKLWNKTAPQTDAIVNSLSVINDKGELGSVLHDCSVEQLIILSIEAYEIIAWWLEYGQHQKTPIDAKQLIALGCPKNHLLGQALRSAQKSAWRGESPDTQLLLACQAWKP